MTGPRQIGKTTLLREVARLTNRPAPWLNCDDRADLTNVRS